MEKRQEERIPVEALPECLKNVIISAGIFEEYSASTINASNNGIGFIVDGINEHEIVNGDNITIKIDPYGYKLKSRVSYVKILDDKKIKLGVSFVKDKALDKYQEILALGIYKK